MESVIEYNQITISESIKKDPKENLLQISIYIARFYHEAAI
jgi:hypothetical protein